VWFPQRSPKVSLLFPVGRNIIFSRKVYPLLFKEDVTLFMLPHLDHLPIWKGPLLSLYFSVSILPVILAIVTLTWNETAGPAPHGAYAFRLIFSALFSIPTTSFLLIVRKAMGEVMAISFPLSPLLCQTVPMLSLCCNPCNTSLYHVFSRPPPPQRPPAYVLPVS